MNSPLAVYIPLFLLLLWIGWFIARYLYLRRRDPSEAKRWSVDLAERQLAPTPVSPRTAIAASVGLLGLFLFGFLRGSAGSIALAITAMSVLVFMLSNVPRPTLARALVVGFVIVFDYVRSTVGAPGPAQLPFPGLSIVVIVSLTLLPFLRPRIERPFNEFHRRSLDDYYRRNPDAAGDRGYRAIQLNEEERNDG